MHGLYLLWWVQEKHVSAATVALILALGDLALMALEVPTGFFADTFGHRKSLIAGSAVQVAGMLLCWLGQGVPGLLAASLLVGLGDAFRSGADQALLYRTCVALDCETYFQRIQGRTYAWQAGRCSSRSSRAVLSSNAGALRRGGSWKRSCAESAWASRAR